ncbi:MAG TPA: GNAT family N-acetyltransferase [Candidatus Limnocylindrales bacterium]|nr:GNAT family N-acetyltransferase [Candidatus Limnocylindrales bacterium]
MGLSIRTFRSGDLAAASELLAAAQRRAQAGCPSGLRLGSRYLDASACRSAIEQLVAAPRATSVVAESHSRVVGFLCGEKQLFAPEDFASIYAEPRSTNVPLHGHAVDAESDVESIYEAMYGALATRWVADGFFIHNIAVSALDPGIVDAWMPLGFGRKSVCAVRPTMRLESDAFSVTGVTIEEIRGRDDEALDTFHRHLMTYQTGAPMFWPYTGESDVRVRGVRRDALLSGQGFAYIARSRSGEALGSLLFVPSVFLSPLLVCEKMIYLWEGFVEEGHRSAGVGSMLLDHAMVRLNERGIEWCALHFVSGNPRGGHFWPSKGFRPVEYVLHRHVDERVAWARGFAT